ncbi:MAG: serine/threonine-protein kinase, partial [Polyangiales bacterium]
MKPISPQEPVGTVIANRYRVEQTLGRGGMAVVYRVHDQRTGSELALKRTLARDARRRQRHDVLLEREYHTLTQLAHPHIIAVRDYGVDPSGPYYTMELLEGTDLEHAERMPWREVCALLCDVASAVAMLHSRGLVHRDVSARNVRRTADGRVKLIDFGAMMPMTVAKDVVGTPPFMAPEVLQLQALDGRADLFSLGALGYHLLTGRHAFEAKRLRELRDVWRSRPTPPATVVPDIPTELSQLILQLLSLDRAGRPHTAAEVIERLRTVADLKLSDTADVSRAYLTTPTLVGRDSQLLRVRKRMLGLVRGDGGALLFEGESGSGRSRMLDACALEGKLLGAAVVRADARDAAQGEWGVARMLANQLLSEFPQQAVDAARLSRNVLAHVVEELRSDEVRTATGYAPERSVLVRELRDWILSLAKVQRLLVVVDDADRIDDPSAALLSALAHKAERYALLVAVAVERDVDHQASAAQHLLHDIADRIELVGIKPNETELLIRSLFGDVPNLLLCATRIHALALGNPRTTMALAQHLVHSGLARYEAGSWALPAHLEETDLPTSSAASLSSRLTDLSKDARELIDALALADADALRVAAYPALTEHRQPKRVFNALDELVSARILTAAADRFTFTERGFIPVLVEVMTKTRRAQLHQRIARLLGSTGGDLLRRAHHLLAAGGDAEAIQLLGRVDLATQSPSVGLLATAIERGEALQQPAAVLHRLRIALLVHAPFSMNYATFRRVAPVVLEQLDKDTGLARYRALSGTPTERLTQALTQA